ncbi:uncharacterized protein LOC141842788 [Curcuma longa]|uniref:uncharacterized protein LOC141842788 n=1 Tax=Curcuma longa TaxID=136217 RepID=UPI003D9F8D5C
MDMDLAIRTEQPPTPTVASSLEEKAKFEKWERSNRMSLMIIKRAIPEVFRGAVFKDTTNAKNYLAELEKRFAKSDKAETSTILKSLISMKYKGNGHIREYIMEMSSLASKLKLHGLSPVVDITMVEMAGVAAAEGLWSSAITAV